MLFHNVMSTPSFGVPGYDFYNFFFSVDFVQEMLLLVKKLTKKDLSMKL